MTYHVLEQSSRLFDGYIKSFKVAGKNLLLVQEEGRLYLIENRCPHMDVPLDTGTVLPEGKIRCRAHGIVFSLDTGKAQGPLAETLDCLTHFGLAYEGNTVGIYI